MLCVLGVFWKFFLKKKKTKTKNYGSLAMNLVSFVGFRVF